MGGDSKPASLLSAVLALYLTGEVILCCGAMLYVPFTPLRFINQQHSVLKRAQSCTLWVWAQCCMIIKILLNKAVSLIRGSPLFSASLVCLLSMVLAWLASGLSNGPGAGAEHAAPTPKPPGSTAPCYRAPWDYAAMAAVVNDIDDTLQPLSAYSPTLSAANDDFVTNAQELFKAREAMEQPISGVREDVSAWLLARNNWAAASSLLTSSEDSVAELKAAVASNADKVSVQLELLDMSGVRCQDQHRLLVSRDGVDGTGCRLRAEIARVKTMMVESETSHGRDTGLTNVMDRLDDASAGVSRLATLYNYDICLEALLSDMRQKWSGAAGPSQGGLQAAAGNGLEELRSAQETWMREPSGGAA